MPVLTRRAGRRRRLLIVGAVAGAAVVLAGAWLGWLTWKITSALNDATNAAALLQQSLTAGDERTSRAALATLEEHSERAKDRTGGVSWSVVSHLPVVG